MSVQGTLIALTLGAAWCSPGKLAAADSTPSADSVPATQAVDPAAKQLLAAQGLLQRKLFKLAAEQYDQFLREYPDHAQATSARYGLAICDYNQGQLSDAEPLLVKVLTDPAFAQSDEALSLVGYCELSLKKYPESIAHFDALLAKYPNSTQADAARLYRAEALYLCGRMTDAANDCQTYITGHTTGGDLDAAYYYLALSQHAQNKDDAALVALDKLASVFPQSGYHFDGELLRGQILLAQNKSADAVASLQKLAANAVPARAGEAHYWLGVALVSDGRLNECTGEFIAASHSSDPELAKSANLRLGLAQLALGSINSARQVLTPMAEGTSTQSDDARFGLAQCDLAEKKFSDAAAKLDLLLSETPALANHDQIALYRGLCRVGQNQLPAAAADFDALAKGAAHPAIIAEAMYRAAYCYHDLGKLPESLSRCDQLAQLSPSPFTRPGQELAAADLFELGKYAEAKSAFEKLAQTSDELSRQRLYRFRCAQCDYYSGQFDSVVSQLSPIVSDPAFGSQPELSGAVLLLGDAQLQSGKNADAEKNLKLAVAQGGAGIEEARYKLALAQIRQSENDAAATELKLLVAGSDQSPWVLRGLLALAQMQYKSGKADASAQSLDRLLAANPPADLAGSALYLRGWIDYDGKKYVSAADRWKNLVEQFPTHALASDAAYQRGGALQQANQLDAAVSAYLDFAKTNPNSPGAPRARQLAAAILSSQGKDADALAILTELARQPHATDTALYDLAWAQRKAKQLSSAETTYRRIISDYPDGDLALASRAELGELLYGDKNYTQAAAFLWPVVSGRKGDPRVLGAAGYRLGWCYQKMGDPDKAAGAFRDFASTFPDDPMVPSALIQAALADADANRIDQAKTELADVLKRYPDHPDATVAMLKMSDLEAAEEQYSAAEQTARDFLLKYPAHALTYRAEFCLGWALENQKKYADARDAYQKVIAISNGETAARAQFQIGETDLAEQKYEAAVAAFLAVEDVYAYPQWSARALLEAGRSFEQLKQFDQAKAQYNQLLIKYKSAPEAELAAARLREIGG